MWESGHGSQVKKGMVGETGTKGKMTQKARKGKQNYVRKVRRRMKRVMDAEKRCERVGRNVRKE